MANEPNPYLPDRVRWRLKAVVAAPEKIRDLITEGFIDSICGRLAKIEQLEWELARCAGQKWKVEHERDEALLKVSELEGSLMAQEMVTEEKRELLDKLGAEIGESGINADSSLWEKLLRQRDEARERLESMVAGWNMLKEESDEYERAWEADNAALRAEVERLTRERDEARQSVRHYREALTLPSSPPLTHADGAHTQVVEPVKVGALMADNAALRAEIERLREEIQTQSASRKAILWSLREIAADVGQLTGMRLINLIEKWEQRETVCAKAALPQPESEGA